MSKAMVYLIPAPLNEEGFHTINQNITDAVKDCQVFFVENERTARRYLKRIWKEMVIDDYEWYVMNDTEELSNLFKQKLISQKRIGIISEAGCPGIADPGQLFVAMAQEKNITIKPLTGPSSILLALMASGLNGQQFKFVGYLPIKDPERSKVIRNIESDSLKNNCTHIFIETPYRNNQLLDALFSNCKPTTKLCIAVELTGKKEWVKTKTISEWKIQKPDIHKRPAIFCLQA